MDIAIELSLYPLEQDRVPKIKDFIERLNGASGVRVITNSLSTQVVGPYELVFAALTREIKATFDSVEKSVVVMKIIGPLSNAGLITEGCPRRRAAGDVRGRSDFGAPRRGVPGARGQAQPLVLGGRRHQFGIMIWLSAQKALPMQAWLNVYYVVVSVYGYWRWTDAAVPRPAVTLLPLRWHDRRGCAAPGR